VLALFLDGPGGWSQLADLFVCGVRDALEDVGEVGVRVDAAPTAAFYDAVDDGAAVASVSSTDEEPVFLTDGCGTHRVLGMIVINFNTAFCDVDLESFPLAQRIVDGTT